MSSDTVAKIISPKFSSTPRTKIDSWVPYYAGFSGDFVRSLLKHSQAFKLKNNPIVYDPWSGVGTTLYTASAAGYRAFGGDVNPFAIDVSRSKSRSLLGEVQNLNSATEQILSTNKLVEPSDGILEYFSPQSSAEICGILQSIEDFAWTDLEIINGNIYSPSRSMFTSALISVCQESANIIKASNPSWEKSLGGALLSLNFRDKLRKLLRDRLNDLENLYQGGENPQHYAVKCDNRLSCVAEDFDIIITSPPYLTRIDYAMNTKFAISFYEDHKNFRLLRESSTGSPVIRNDSDFSDSWGDYTKEIDSLISSHPSKASVSYYLKVYRQYVKDVYTSMTNISGGASDNAIGYIIVQSSYYKEIPIDLGRIMIEAAQFSGLDGKVLAKASVGNTMSRVNTKSSEYKKDKVYSEDTIFISNH